MDINFNDKMKSAERESAILNILQECKKIFTLHKNDQLSATDVKTFLQTQEILLRTGVYLTVNWDSKSYKAIDVQAKKEYQ